jgi:hypothetical protein
VPHHFIAIKSGAPGYPPNLQGDFTLLLMVFPSNMGISHCFVLFYYQHNTGLTLENGRSVGTCLASFEDNIWRFAKIGVPLNHPCYRTFLYKPSIYGNHHLWNPHKYHIIYIISYHIISDHIISYHIISYHIYILYYNII